MAYERDFANYISGLTDGEGCFTVRVGIRRGGELQFAPKFAISLLSSDIEILKSIKKLLDCGTLQVWSHNGSEMATFSVNRLEDLQGIIVPFFEKFPLRAKKKKDFDVWKMIVRSKVKYEQSSRGYKEALIQLWRERGK